MASTWCFGGLNISSTNNGWDSGDNELLSSLNKWWDSNNNELFSSWHICDDATGCLNTCHLSYCGLECVARILKIKRSKHPWAYYSNSSATFHDCLLEGDLVFTLNRGPIWTVKIFQLLTVIVSLRTMFFCLLGQGARPISSLLIDCLSTKYQTRYFLCVCLTRLRV